MGVRAQTQPSVPDVRQAWPEPSTPAASAASAAAAVQAPALSSLDALISGKRGGGESPCEAADWLSMMSLQGTISHKAAVSVLTSPALILRDSGRFKETVLFFCALPEGNVKP